MKLGSSDSNCHRPLLLQPTTIGPACKLPPDAENPQATRCDVPALVLMPVPVLMLMLCLEESCPCMAYLPT